MTEAEWWAATSAGGLTDWLFFDTRASDRKLRLFAVACCRCIEDRVLDAELLARLDMTENYVDGVGTEAAFISGQHSAWAAFQRRFPKGDPSWERVVAAQLACLNATSVPDGPQKHRYRERDNYDRESDNYGPYVDASDVEWAASRTLDALAPVGADGGSTICHAHQLHQARLLHDIFGPLPFREVAIAPEWLTSDVTVLAQGIYDDKAFDRMPILADALQDAGCDNDEILNHCRDEKCEHVRGCWVLDLLLGKPWRAGV